jgi:hypothetical protein
LQGKSFDGTIEGLGIIRAQFTFLVEGMTRMMLRSRRLVAVSIFLLLAGVVVLSAATRCPCLHARTGPWHVAKAGYMTNAESKEVCRLRVNGEAQTRQTAPEESPALTPAIYFPCEETIPPINSIVVPIHHFRSPPTLG